VEEKCERQAEKSPEDERFREKGKRQLKLERLGGKRHYNPIAENQRGYETKQSALEPAKHEAAPL